MMEYTLDFRRHIKRNELDESNWLEMYEKVFFRRKNKVVRKLDDAVEILAAAFRFKMDYLRQDDMGGIVIMSMVVTMRAGLLCRGEATCHAVFLSAIVEFDVPAYRNEEHHKGHE